MNRHEKVCVVIPHGGAFDTLAQQLVALGRQSLPATEIIVSCNRPGSAAEARSALADPVNATLLGLPLTLIDSSARPGPSAARNAGWQTTKLDTVLFCDDDDLVDPDWVRELARCLRTHSIAGGSLHYERLNSKRAALRSGVVMLNAPRKFDYLAYAPSSNLGARLEVLRTLNGFDETLDCAEDIDLCWRAQEAGYSFGFEPEAIVHYKLRERAGAAFKQSYRYGLHDGALLDAHREHGARRTLRAGLHELAGIPLSFVRLCSGRADLADLSQRAGALLGRVTSSVRQRIWVV